MESLAQEVDPFATEFSRANDMKLVGVHMIRIPHNPDLTHRIAYTCQSPFLRINTTSFHFYLAYYLYALS